MKVHQESYDKRKAQAELLGLRYKLDPFIRKLTKTSFKLVSYSIDLTKLPAVIYS